MEVQVHSQETIKLRARPENKSEDTEFEQGLLSDPIETNHEPEVITPYLAEIAPVPETRPHGTPVPVSQPPPVEPGPPEGPDDGDLQTPHTHPEKRHPEPHNVRARPRSPYLRTPTAGQTPGRPTTTRPGTRRTP